jgi:hypothetical protein
MDKRAGAVAEISLERGARSRLPGWKFLILTTTYFNNYQNNVKTTKLSRQAG